MTSILRPMCLDCKNLIEIKMVQACRAFPEKIPMAIWLGEHDHHMPYEGDNGILFESGEPAMYQMERERLAGAKNAMQ
jgi:hypothetical protein